jgi:hypothetical protein
MARIRRSTVVPVLAATLALIGVSLGSIGAGASESDRLIIGYSLLDLSEGEGRLCQLVEVDWSSGNVTVLPATASSLACVNDLAVAPDGTVHGFDPVYVDEFDLGSDIGSAEVLKVGRFVTFGVNGTPSSIDVDLPQSYTMNNDLFSQFWGIAITENGSIFVTINRLLADVTTCEPGVVIGSLEFESSDGVYDWTSCLFSLDPSTGQLTLVGPSAVPGDNLAGLSIGSDGARTILWPLAPRSLSPSDGPDVIWSSVDLSSGATTASGLSYSASNGLFDQLRSLPTLFVLLRDDTSFQFSSGTVDPETGVITRVAPLKIGGEPIRSPDLRPVLGITTRSGPAPAPVVPAFTG